MKIPLLVSLVLLAFVPSTHSECSDRRQRDPAMQGAGDEGFYLSVNGQPEFYQPGNLYTVTLAGDQNEWVTELFTEFVLVVENAAYVEGLRMHPLPPGSSGSFQLLGDVLTRFSDHCTNTITQTSKVAKEEIQVLWTAPPVGSGCVVFRATVVDVIGPWAMDSDRLSLRLCEAPLAEHQSAGADPVEVNDPCCACEEAKYEVTFQGLWSPETHPKDFPKARWLTHFSDIIGASHSADYRVWRYNGFASKGLSQVAKWGSPRILESELKSESNHIRTIIKARGLWYPNVNGKTFAVFRTDRRKHLVSLVSMLGPSPDWIVGVSGLELCLKNCSWAERREVYLYPWDAGVDSGISYESPDEPTVPQQLITRITARHPADPRQPFFNETGQPMAPLAKLTVERQRLYRKECSEDQYEDGDGFVFSQFNQDTSDDDEEEGVQDPLCETSAWSDWSGCSVTCGKGLSMRTRSFLSPAKATMAGCDRQLTQKEMCAASVAMCQDHQFYLSAPSDFLPDDMCATSEWSRWSQCSTTCGKGFKSRTRRFFNRTGRKKCPHVDTMEKSLCAGALPVCDEVSASPGEHQVDPHCAVTSWSEWSPCSVSCGTGLKVRTRLYKVSPQQQTNAECNIQLMEKSACEGDVRRECKFSDEDAKLICGLKKEVGHCRGSFPRWYYDSLLGMCVQFMYSGCRGNSNNFDDYNDCVKLCEKSNVTNSNMMIKKYQTDNESPDRLSLLRRKQEMMQQQSSTMQGKRDFMLMKNHAMVTFERERAERAKDAEAASEQEVDCLVTAWSPWSQCEPKCGRSFRRKFRQVTRFPSEGGKQCPKKMERRQKCRVPPCDSSCLLVGDWGEWSPCSESCGQNGVQQRTRDVLYHRQEDDVLEESSSCGTATTEKRVCLLAACPNRDEDLSLT